VEEAASSRSDKEEWRISALGWCGKNVSGKDVYKIRGFRAGLI